MNTDTSIDLFSQLAAMESGYKAKVKPGKKNSVHLKSIKHVVCHDLNAAKIVTPEQKLFKNLSALEDEYTKGQSTRNDLEHKINNAGKQSCH